MPLRDVLERAISYIDCELSLVEMELEYPQRSLDFPPDITPLAQWGGSVADLVEYMIAPQASGLLQKPSGKPMTFEEAIDLVEKIFGITISNPHDRRGKVLDRQKNTTFQDEMRQVFLAEAKKRSK